MRVGHVAHGRHETSANKHFEPGGLRRLGRRVKDGPAGAGRPADMARLVRPHSVRRGATAG